VSGGKTRESVPSKADRTGCHIRLRRRTEPRRRSNRMARRGPTARWPRRGGEDSVDRRPETAGWVPRPVGLRPCPAGRRSGSATSKRSAAGTGQLGGSPDQWYSGRGGCRRGSSLWPLADKEPVGKRTSGTVERAAQRWERWTRATLAVRRHPRMKGEDYPEVRRACQCRPPPPPGLIPGPTISGGKAAAPQQPIRPRNRSTLWGLFPRLGGDRLTEAKMTISLNDVKV